MQDLAVDKDVKAGKVIPNQYLILSFNFARINRSSDLKAAEFALNNMINNSMKKFYQTYASYMGSDTAKELIQTLIDPADSVSSLTMCTDLVQAILRVAEGVNNHPLADVKGVSNRLCLHCSWLSYCSCL